MTTRTVLLALCISISRQGHRDQMGSRPSDQMDRLGMVSKVLKSNVLDQLLTDAGGGQMVYYRQTACPQTLTSGYKSTCTC